MKINNPVVRLMKKYINRQNAEKLNDLLSEIHVIDLIKRMNQLEPTQKKSFFQLLKGELLAEIFSALEIDDQLEVISWLNEKKKRELFINLPTDDVVDLLGEMEEERAKELLLLVEDRQEVERLLKYDLDTAAGLMTTEFIAVNHMMTAKETIRDIKNWVDHAETIYYIYVVDDNHRLEGVISLRELLAAEENSKLQDIMKENIVKVDENIDQEEAAHIIAKYDLIALPVVNEKNELAGIITVDDIVDVIEEEATEDLFKKAGLLEIREDETYRSAKLIDANVPTVLRIRLPWLMIALVGGLMAGGVIGQFETTLESIVALAFFVPVIMDMGGNVGTQSSTIFVRGLVLGHIELPHFARYLLKEIQVGMALGAISSLLVGAIAYLWQGIYALSLVVGISMFLTVTLATTIGYLIPFLVFKMGFDPAAGSDPLITTIKDVTGLVIYFSLANILLAALL